MWVGFSYVDEIDADATYSQEGNVFLHGATPGTSQELTPTNHPHLRLTETMIPYPTVNPGDTGE